MTPRFETEARGNCILGAKESGKYANLAKLALNTAFYGFHERVPDHFSITSDGYFGNSVAF